MQKITTFLWFNNQAEAAAKFYVSLFKNSKIGKKMYYGDFFPDKKGQVMTVSFTLAGQKFIALNGDSEFKFTPAISLFILCKTQKEVDRIWKKLTTAGKEIQCGWVTDKFGVTWQVVPEGLMELIGDKNPEKAKRATAAMCSMVKLDIAKIRRAHAGK